MEASNECPSCGSVLRERFEHVLSMAPERYCCNIDCPRGPKTKDQKRRAFDREAPRAPSVPDPVADTARALAGKWEEADRELRTGKYREPDRASWLWRRETIADCARACGPQVEAAFRALVTGDVGREPGVGDA